MSDEQRMRDLWIEERTKREAAEHLAQRLEAYVRGLLIDAYEEKMPLYRRIGNQRHELRRLNDIQHLWHNIITPEERRVFIDRWIKQRQQASNDVGTGDA